MCFECIEKCLSGLDCIDLAWITNMMIFFFFFLNHQNLNLTIDECYLVCPLSGDTIKNTQLSHTKLTDGPCHVKGITPWHELGKLGIFCKYFGHRAGYTYCSIHFDHKLYISVIKWHNPWVCPYMLPRCLLWALKWISIHCSFISALSTRLVSALSSDDRTPCSPWEIMLVWV